jgi:DNA-binding MarR family transcriptional regulator
MNTGIFGQLSRLMETVDSTMTELSLGDLSSNERAVLFAMTATATRDEGGLPVCHTEHARAHRLARQISQPTFHRNLRRLIERGLVAKTEGLAPGEYVIRVPQDETADAMV